MITRTDSLTAAERHQRIVLCTATYYNMNGRIPDASELCRCLGHGYLKEIVCYLKNVSFPEVVCA